MIDCPDCHSSSVQSKGNKHTKHGVTHRYVCNDCGRNFTVNPNANKVKLDNTENQTDIKLGVNTFDREVWQKQYHAENTTITISKDTKQWLETLKNYKKEPINSVLIRIKNKQVEL